MQRRCWVSVGARVCSLCSECWGLDRVWVGGDKVSEVEVTPGWPWQRLGDRPEDWLCQEPVSGFGEVGSRWVVTGASGATYECVQSCPGVRWKEVGGGRCRERMKEEVLKSVWGRAFLWG